MATATQGIDIVVGAKTEQATAAMALIQGFVQGVGQAVANFAGRAARALAEMTGEAIHTADEMGKLAQKAGTTSEKFSAIAYAAKLSDVSLDGLQMGFKGLSAWMEKNGQVGRDVLDVMLEQADAFAAMEDGAAKTNLALELFGRAGVDMIPLLNQGSEAIREQMDQAKMFGLVISTQTAKQAETFNDRITEMGERFSGVFVQLAEKLLPGLLSLTDSLLATVDDGGPFLDFLLEAGGLMAKAAESANYLAAKWQLTTTAMGSFAGSIWAGLSVTEAWEEASKDSAAAQEAFTARVEAYRQKREKVDKAVKTSIETAVEFASAIDLLRLRYDQLSTTRGDLAPEAQLERLGEQLGILREIQSLIGDPAKSNGKLTAAGLEQAKSLLEVEKEIAALNREKLGLMDRLYPKIELVKSQWQEMLEALDDHNANFAENFMGTLGMINDSLGRIVGDVITRAQTMGQAWGSAGKQAAAAISNMVSTYVAGKLSMMVVDRLFSKSSQQGAAGTAAVSGVAGIAKAGEQGGIWGVLAYIAVFAAAMAAISGMTSLATSRFAEGGSVLGPGTGTSDSILARLSNGEFVINAAAADSIGHDQLAQMNQTGSLPSDGGNSGNPSIAIAVFGGEADAKRWAESQDGEVWFLDMLRKGITRYS